MLDEALLDNRRQELLKAFVHLPLSDRPDERDDLHAERPLARAAMRRANARSRGTRRTDFRSTAILT
jgi:hypothetical protein